jgi:hypothetical protein
MIFTDEEIALIRQAIETIFQVGFKGDMQSVTQTVLCANQVIQKLAILEQKTEEGEPASD